MLMLLFIQLTFNFVPSFDHIAGVLSWFFFPGTPTIEKQNKLGQLENIIGLIEQNEIREANSKLAHSLS